MKVIVSHDIDHLRTSEHLSDLIVPKFIARSTIELTKGMINLQEYLGRIKMLILNKMENIREIMAFNRSMSVPATFFIGVNQGLGLNYQDKLAQTWMKVIQENGFDIGVHGISYEDKQQMQLEFDTFSNLSGFSEFGIRMHYLRKNISTCEILESIGYQFDSSEYEIKNPYRIGGMWEFPLHIMDGYEIEAGKPWQSRTLQEAKEATLRRLDLVLNESISYHTILFHDRYFNASFSTWMNWYTWYIDYLKTIGSGFISYKEAVSELNASSNK